MRFSTISVLESTLKGLQELVAAVADNRVDFLTALWRTAATSRSTVSPAWWPLVSLMALKLSTSTMMKPRVVPSRRALLSSRSTSRLKWFLL